jgi:hypothetical protein
MVDEYKSEVAYGDMMTVTIIMKILQFVPMLFPGGNIGTDVTIS